MLKEKRVRRHLSIRKRLVGTTVRPRVAVFRSAQHIYAQLIDDVSQKTLFAESDIKLKSGTKKERAGIVGENLAKKALTKKVKQIVFDRGGFRYHGRIAAVAEGLRKGGLEF